MTEADRIEQIVEERARALAVREATVARDRRLAAVGQLAAGVMHDVNNALASTVPTTLVILAGGSGRLAAYVDRLDAAQQSDLGDDQFDSHRLRRRPLSIRRYELIGSTTDRRRDNERVRQS